jgi:hypothetical protein
MEAQLKLTRCWTLRRKDTLQTDKYELVEYICNALPYYDH